MSNVASPPVFTRSVDVQAEGALPKSLHVVATDGERVRLADWLEIPGVDSFEADVTFEKWQSKGVRVRGTFEGRVTQTCVVTLEPLDNTVSGSFEWHFRPEALAATTKRDLELQLEEIDVEPLESGKIDIGSILAEELSLALDPHPRKADAVLETGQAEMGQETKENPFAALKALKAKDSTKGAG